MNGVLGISKKSLDDTIIIRTDDNLNTKWIVSVDINNTYDLFLSSISDENTTYCMSINYKLVSCLYKLNYSTGEFINSKWHQHTQNNGIVLTSSSLKAIKMLKWVDDKLIANFKVQVGKSKLMFCKFAFFLFYSFKINFGYQKKSIIHYKIRLLYGMDLLQTYQRTSCLFLLGEQYSDLPWAQILEKLLMNGVTSDIINTINFRQWFQSW